jgi:hypothetical protein
MHKRMFRQQEALAENHQRSLERRKNLGIPVDEEGVILKKRSPLTQSTAFLKNNK